MVKKPTINSAATGIFKITTRSPAQTRAVAEKLSQALSAGTIIGLIGDLGSGKTTFVKGLTAGASTESFVSSPSFVLEKIYLGKPVIYHVDLYRLKTPVDFSEFLEPLSGEGIWAIEWADKIPVGFFEGYDYLGVEFTHKGGNMREIVFRTNSEKIKRILNEITGD